MLQRKGDGRTGQGRHLQKSRDRTHFALVAFHEFPAHREIGKQTAYSDDAAPAAGAPFFVLQLTIPELAMPALTLVVVGADQINIGHFQD